MANQTIGNPNLEAEYMASWIIAGKLNDPAYGGLRIDLAGIPFVPLSPAFTAYLIEIQDMILDKFGLIRNDKVDAYYYGKNPELYELLRKVYSEVETALPVYAEAIPQQFEEAFIDLLAKNETSDQSYAAYDENTSSISPHAATINEMEETLTDLERLEASLRNILMVHEVKHPKLSKNKKITPQVDSDYLIYLQMLAVDVDQVTDNMQLAMDVGMCIDAITSLYPKDNLDPYLTDVCQNAIDVLVDPKAFYNMCQHDEILSSSVGQMFAHCYPEFYQKYLDMYMDSYDEMAYQQQIDFRKCFALDADDSELTALCSRYVKLGFSQQQS